MMKGQQNSCMDLIIGHGVHSSQSHDDDDDDAIILADTVIKFTRSDTVTCMHDIISWKSLTLHIPGPL